MRGLPRIVIHFSVASWVGCRRPAQFHVVRRFGVGGVARQIGAICGVQEVEERRGVRDDVVRFEPVTARLP
jgi:hypothetical protein